MKLTSSAKTGIISYGLSVLYFLLNFVVHESTTKIFITIHLVFVGFTLLTIFWVVVLVGLAYGPRSNTATRQKIGLMAKTLPHRAALGLSYWAAPLGMYFYDATNNPYLYIFKWLPIWYPILFYYGERWIAKKEAAIHSPTLAYEQQEE